MCKLFVHSVVAIAMFASAVMTSAQSPSMLDLRIKTESSNGIIVANFINQGTSSIKLWKGANSWAWDNVRFVIIRNHVSFYFRRNPAEAFTRNGPAYYDVKKLESVAHAFDIFDGSWLASEGAPQKLVKGDTIICAYAVNSTPEAAKYNVWVGTACAITNAE